MTPSVLTRLPTQHPDETEALGLLLGHVLQAGDVVGLVGELGAGKTCFTRGVARGLGVPPDVLVSSPTFTLVNEYSGRLTLYHIDLYRLSEPEELREVGVDAYYRGDGVCLVEWFDRFPAETPEERMVLRFEVLGDQERCIVPDPGGPRHEALMRDWTRRIADLT